ncbi:Heat shock cognate 70 kDa protein 2-like [Heracleum sosnowskyi]|uniref:Heat shock cognate 70 kDa protein 2-like n=1 Tax=Heracleum sosnowskyi TaxID=360622 RepID=A0AAD8MMG8_9APIA|nr:Heat shock cognate 70 kDa protein 2-like [Heracleum sosnowskyi]
MANNNGVSVGIDLGTKYSRVAVWRHGRVEIIEDGEGNRTIPSCVAFTDRERLIGLDATYQATLDPVNTIFDVKRLIGRRVTDSTVKSDMKLWPFKILSIMSSSILQAWHLTNFTSGYSLV